ncbi:MAG TPA: ABC transporter permease [Methylocella sp.]|nr:ABC transporter permease [Methylocella sp.]
MTLGGYLNEALVSLRLNALRSTLTAIGVIIGVAGIIVLGAANGGAAYKIDEQIAMLGSRTLTVFSSAAANAGVRGPAVMLSDEDAAVIREHVPDIQFVSREVDGKVTIIARNTSWTAEYSGVDSSYADVFDVRLAKGRFFDDAEVRHGVKVIVLGATVARKLFGEESPIGKSARVEGVPMKIIGVRVPLGKFGGAGDLDNSLMVPITLARTRLPQFEKTPAAHQLSQIDVKLVPDANREATKQAILALMRERKHVRDGEQEKFEVFDASQFVELLNTTGSSLSWLLGATAVISLVVGGVGIMNIMLVTVTERTHEIGLRMAIGARKRDILSQFLMEAIVLCVVAGAVGLALGIVGGYIVARLSGWPLIIGPGTVTAAVLASAGVGIVFGYLPARRAAALNPIDALRRE